jgi:hypothetical protein
MPCLKKLVGYFWSSVWSQQTRQIPGSRFGISLPKPGSSWTSIVRRSTVPPVLIHTSDGITEAAWEPGIRIDTPNGEEADGFCWTTSDGDTYELDEIQAWMPVPSSETPERPATPPSDEVAFLVLSKDHGWVEAWYDTQIASGRLWTRNSP